MRRRSGSSRRSRRRRRKKRIDLRTDVQSIYKFFYLQINRVIKDGLLLLGHKRVYLYYRHSFPDLLLFRIINSWERRVLQVVKRKALGTKPTACQHKRDGKQHDEYDGLRSHLKISLHLPKRIKPASPNLARERSTCSNDFSWSRRVFEKNLSA